MDGSQGFSRPYSRGTDVSRSFGGEHERVYRIQAAQDGRCHLRHTRRSTAVVRDNIAHSHVLPSVPGQRSGTLRIQRHTPGCSGIDMRTGVQHGSCCPHLMDKLLDSYSLRIAYMVA